MYHSHGPNFVWHVDGYNKLKPFGIGRRVCIDGFSRSMIWLEAYKTNKDPRLIAGYFMDAVIKAGGCPARVRLDLGTENVHLAEMQFFFTFSEDRPEMLLLAQALETSTSKDGGSLCEVNVSNFG